MTGDINLFLAFAAGLLSFVSPCTLPLYPSFLSYVTGVSVDELKERNGMMQKRAILHTAFFLLGFSVIFLVLGLSTTVIGSLFNQYQDLLRQIGAIFIVFFGFVILGVFKPKFLMKDWKVNFKNRPAGYTGSSVIGMGFAAGWTPCMGPILAAVIAMGVANPGSAVIYTIAYTLGFAVPFFILAFFIGKLRWIKRHNRIFMKVGGSLMIVMGVFLYFDWMTKIITWLIPIYGGFTGF